MERDEIIRIIIEGRDKLSNVAKSARQNVDKDLKGLEKSVNSLDKSIGELDKDFDRAFRRIDSGGGILGRVRKRVQGLNEDVKDLKAGLTDLDSTRANATDRQGLIRSAREGLASARGTRQEIANAIQSAKAERDALIQTIRDGKKERLAEIKVTQKAEEDALKDRIRA